MRAELSNKNQLQAHRAGCMNQAGDDFHFIYFSISFGVAQRVDWFCFICLSGLSLNQHHFESSSTCVFGVVWLRILFGAFASMHKRFSWLKLSNQTCVTRPTRQRDSGSPSTMPTNKIKALLFWMVLLPQCRTLLSIPANDMQENWRISRLTPKDNLQFPFTDAENVQCHEIQWFNHNPPHMPTGGNQSHAFRKKCRTSPNPYITSKYVSLNNENVCSVTCSPSKYEKIT